MSETHEPDLGAVAETLLVTLGIRAAESRRPDGLIQDEKAEELVQRMGEQALLGKLALIDDETQVAMILRSRELDRIAQGFLQRHPEAVIVHIGCGLDTRFERVDNGQVEWFDLDLPEVIELRRQLIGGERERYTLLGCSVLSKAWPDLLKDHRRRPCLFLAEGVLMYFSESEIKSLVLLLMERFPGAELAFDAFSPFFSWANNLRVARTKVGARSFWALKGGRSLERWNPGIHLLDERFPFQIPEPRLGRALAVRHIPFLSRVIGIFHYQLGGARRDRDR